MHVCMHIDDVKGVNDVNDVINNYTVYLHRYIHRGVGSGPAGAVLAGPLFIKMKTKFHFAKRK